jgi:hypothetical protein
MLLDASGIEVPYSSPQRNPHVEERARAFLKSKDSLLDIRWVPFAYFNEKQGKMEGAYAITIAWAPIDKRWVLYRSGEIGEPFDILGWYAEDIHNPESGPLSPEYAEERVMKLLASADNLKTPWKKRMLQSMENNKKVREDNKKILGDMIHDEASYLFNQVKHVPIVAVSKEIT